MEKEDLLVVEIRGSWYSFFTSEKAWEMRELVRLRLVSR